MEYNDDRGLTMTTDVQRAIRKLEEKGAVWKANLLSRRRFQDTCELVALVKDGENILRGVVEYYDNTSIKQAKCEVTCYFPVPAHKKKDKEATVLEEFKHGKHPKDKQAKSFEYKDEVRLRLKTAFGFKVGWEPIDPVPAEHTYIAEMCERLCCAAKSEAAVVSAAAKVVKDTEKAEKEVKARRALFG
jgi:hypothetical protein